MTPSAAAPCPPPPPKEAEAEKQQQPWSVMRAELRAQRGIALPLIAMNLTWFGKMAVTTAFLGRLGELELAAGTLGFSFANVTGFAVLTGLCGAMEPICGQAHGAGNVGLLRRTLGMATLMLLAASIPIALLWMRVGDVLRFFLGHDHRHDVQGDMMARIGREYVLCLLPDLVVASFLNPLKAYLSSQEVTLPTLVCSALGLALHIPLTMWLSATKGIRGVAAAVWLTDLAVAVMLAAYVVLVYEPRGRLVCSTRKGMNKENEEEACCSSSSPPSSLLLGLLGSGAGLVGEWVSLLRLAVACCLNTCLEWWSYEILILLTGRLPRDPQIQVGVIAVTLNFDYLLFAAMLSLSVSASVRVSNELGAGDASMARRAARVSIVFGLVSGVAGGILMLAFRHPWALLYSPDRSNSNSGAEVRAGVAKAMKLMALLEVVNFPLNVCGGIVRGTARPLLGMYAVVGGFYVVALPVGVAVGFKAGLGLQGLLAGFLVGAASSLAVLVTVIVRMDWNAEADKARTRARAGLVSSTSGSVGA